MGHFRPAKAGSPYAAAVIVLARRSPAFAQQQRPVVMGPAFAGTTAECIAASVAFSARRHQFRFHEFVKSQDISLATSGKSLALVRSPRPAEGRFAIVTIRGRGMRWTLRRQAACLPGENARSVRRSRVVLAPRPWRYVGGKSAGNGGKKGRFPGESTYKPSNHCAGKAGMSRLYLSNPCALFYLFAHGAAGAVGARLSLRPLVREGQRD